MIKTSGFDGIKIGRKSNGWEWEPRTTYSANFWRDGRSSQMRYVSESNLQGHNWSPERWMQLKLRMEEFRNRQNQFRGQRYY